ncbi:leucine-rich repeat extensin-like protein 2 [Humulus lupulus]|uniref:leucine-rich repeat extensin-like protein 2 n=1 Tax=Humulus lupulus TaxID=3486 RepID=UPI002B4014CD|nr:leucine-rich repeat extensin-like protein 2 [Humulus lupulus]
MNTLASTLLALLVFIEFFPAHARILLPDDDNNIGRSDQIKKTFDMIIRTYDGRRALSPPPSPFPSPRREQVTAPHTTAPSDHYYYKSPPPPLNMDEGARKRSPPPPPQRAPPVVPAVSFLQYNSIMLVCSFFIKLING